MPMDPATRATIARVPLRRAAIIGVIVLASASGLAVAATQYPYGRGTGGCPLFPASNPWRENVAKLPLSPLSSTYIATIGASINLHPDFGSNLTYGIPYVVVPATQPKVAIRFTAYGSQSDKGPYPVPAGAPVEGGAAASGDRHVLVVQSGACKLYELFSAQPNSDGSWSAEWEHFAAAVRAADGRPLLGDLHDARYAWVQVERAYAIAGERPSRRLVAAR